MSFSGRSNEFLDVTLENTDFFPSVSLGEFQKRHRVPSNIADEAVQNQVEIAMGVINDSLIEKEKEWLALNFETLADVDTDDKGTRVRFYKAAVYYRAKAKLLKDFQTFSRRDIASNQATESDDMYSTLMGESYRLIRKLKGLKGTISAELL